MFFNVSFHWNFNYFFNRKFYFNFYYFFRINRSLDNSFNFNDFFYWDFSLEKSVLINDFFHRFFNFNFNNFFINFLCFFLNFSYPRWSYNRTGWGMVLTLPKLIFGYLVLLRSSNLPNHLWRFVYILVLCLRNYLTQSLWRLRIMRLSETLILL